MLVFINNNYYIKDNDLSILFNIKIRLIIKKNKLLKYTCLKINNNYYLDNDNIIYIVRLLNTNNALIIYDKILTSFNLILKYKFVYKKINSI